MLKTIKKNARKYNKKLKILGVTVLTSFSNSSIKKIGHTKSIKKFEKQENSKNNFIDGEFEDIEDDNDGKV